MSDNEHQQGRVMVVDDEPGLRELAVQMLRANGFEAEDVASGEEALARFARQPRAYDLVLLDLAMPQMDGLEVRRAARFAAESAHPDDERLRGSW